MIFKPSKNPIFVSRFNQRKTTRPQSATESITEFHRVFYNVSPLFFAVVGVFTNNVKRGQFYVGENTNIGEKEEKGGIGVQTV